MWNDRACLLENVTYKQFLKKIHPRADSDPNNENVLYQIIHKSKRLKVLIWTWISLFKKNLKKTQSNNK